MATRWKQLKERLQVPIDQDSYYENTTWCNRDLIPMPPERRTWGIWGYFGYWTVSGSCISAWSTGSTLLAFGLSPPQAIGVVAYWGGQATRVLWGAIIPGFAHMKNYFSESSHLLTNDFIGLIIWMAAFIPLVLVPPERLQIPFAISFVLFGSSCIGILIWSVHHAGGPGSMFHEPGSTENVGWAFMFGITAILGAWGAGTLGQSDWTRYANRKFAPTLSQLIAAPITISVTAIIGIIVTSAAKDVLGEIIWNPIYLLAELQEEYHSSPRSRAGVFFASLGLVSSQLAISVVLNSVSTGMDMAGLCPKYINIVRGSYIMAIIGIACQPWQLVSTADRFLKVLSGFGVFMAPATGIMLADYHVIRKAKLKVNDLYNGTSSSIYWFNKGVNWRAIVSFLAGVWPLLPGLVGTVNSITDRGFVGWIRLYNLTFIIGLTISFVVFWTLNWCFPPPGLGEEAPFVDGGVLYGVGEETSIESQKELEASADKHTAVTSLSA
ncbi:hypothetical protein LTR84_012220 [Exophiala bonariae]|uniref:NCS1 nucleoside transporter n=1 Tax=Exophiala bonariae TaxID=1690606 RepID=A0AAV9NJ98_9EURO|nr:hypothetical protein LTR84_012220 [Exophiala bonariae]